MVKYSLFVSFIFIVFGCSLLSAQVRNADFFVKYNFYYLRDTLIADKYSNKAKLLLYGDDKEVIFCSEESYNSDSLVTVTYGDSNLS
jgi:hypothetical protein